jgi:hypothetical protein
MKIRTYLLSSMLFFLLIFIFLFVSAGIDYTGEMYTNNYSAAARQKLLDIAMEREGGLSGTAGVPGAAASIPSRGDDKPYLLVAPSADAIRDPMAWMLSALKLGYVAVPMIPPETQLSDYRGVILVGEDLSLLGDLDVLVSYVDGGGHVLFSELPLPNGPTETAFMETVGVLEIGDYKDYEQCEFYEGLLLGGMVRYDELPIQARHIEFSNLCKVWGVMWVGDPDAREDEVPLMLERRYGDGVFCVVNGPFMKEKYGIGFLHGLLALDETAFVTPVINVATLSLVNFPLLEGDHEKLQTAYARDALTAVRDILWNDLAYTITLNDIPATAFIPSASINYGITYAEFFSFLVRSMSESGSELGVIEGLNYAESLQASLPDYEFAAVYGDGDTEGFAAAVSPLDELTTDFAHYSGGTVRYPVLTEGYSTADQHNLITRGYAAGLMMIHHAIDMSEPITLNTPGFRWKDMNDDFTIALYAVLAPYPYIERLSVSNGSNNFLTYQLTQPELHYTPEGITIDSGIDVPSDFLLRTRLTPEAEEGLSITELEANIYLISMNGREGSIRWNDEDTP